MQLLDNDVSKAETKGRGNCTIPLYLLEANEDIETKEGTLYLSIALSLFNAAAMDNAI